MNQMTAIDAAGADPASPVLRTRPVLSQRAARRGELAYIQTRLSEAIEQMEGINEHFRSFERSRLTVLFLANLHALDANYVRVCLSDDTMAGFMISGPEYGNLWLYWGYVFPEVRTPRMAMVFVRQYLEFWDNGRFHKVSNYTLSSNRAAIALMKRFRFRHACDLPDQVMGQGFMLFERRLDKVDPGYDNGTNLSLVSRLVNRLRCATGLL